MSLLANYEKEMARQDVPISQEELRKIEARNKEIIKEITEESNRLEQKWSETDPAEELPFTPWDIRPILETKSLYNMVIGERSNGKTYGALRYGIKEYFEHGSRIAYLRRWKEDLRGKRGEQIFAGLVENDEVRRLSKGKFTGIKYYAGRWYMTKYDPDLDKAVREDEPFCYGFSLSDMEHDKSASYPTVRTVIFDEFMTRGYYFDNEFVLFMNVLSTIIRYRTDVIVFMLANTVNKYCPYFKEMGLKHIEEMEQGKIDLYTYNNSSLRVAVEYCEDKNKRGKPSDIYFSFDSPSLAMITSGSWELAMYPHLVDKFTPSNVNFQYFIQFGDHVLQAEIVTLGNRVFTYIHEKTTPIKNPERDIVFTPEADGRPNYYYSLAHPSDDLSRKILSFFKQQKVFYQNNEVGEIVRNFMMSSNPMALYKAG